MPDKLIVVLSDLQIPYHNEKALLNVYDFIRETNPDMIASVGDDVDFPQVSRWNKGMEGEYVGDLQDHVDAGVQHFTTLRSIFDGPIHVMRSNHMDRPLTYVRKYAPGLMGLDALTVPSLLKFKELDIEYHEEPYVLAPDWVLAHGDEMGTSVRSPGGTALSLARKWGMSVVCGHTHKLGLQHDHETFNLITTGNRFGFEVGNLMNLKEASYLKAGYANWQPGFGLLFVGNRTVDPVPVLVRPDGSFQVNGYEYGR